MKEKETGKQTNEPSSVIEDLTLDETSSENVKGGPSDYLLELDGIKGESKDSRSAGRAGYDQQKNVKL